MSGITSFLREPQVFRSTKDNVTGDELTSVFTQASVSVDVERDVPMQFTGEISNVTSLQGFEWIAPFLRISYYDRELQTRVVSRGQVGLYLIMPLDETHTAGSSRGKITGYDPTWILSKDLIASSYKCAKGTNAVKHIRDLIAAAGFKRSNITARAGGFKKTVVYDPGMSRLEIINDICHRIGYYPIFADRHGMLTTHKIKTLNTEVELRRIRTADNDVLDTVSIDRDEERLCNRVVYYKQGTEKDDAIKVVLNAPARSPVSQQNLGFVLGKTVSAGNIEDEEDATAQARKLLEEGASVLTRVQVTTLPDPEFSLRDVIYTHIDRDDGTEVARGKWWVDGIDLPLTGGGMTWHLNKLIDFEPDE